MKITDSFVVKAPAQTVWDFLLDVERMAACLPGVESIEKVDDTTFRGRLKVRVGIITSSFNGVVRLSEVDPPHRLVALIEADDKSSASQMKSSFTSELSSEGDSTRVNYSMEVNLRGRFAQFGSAVMQGTAKKMTRDFVQCLQRSILAQGGA